MLDLEYVFCGNVNMDGMSRRDSESSFLAGVGQGQPGVGRYGLLLCWFIMMIYKQNHKYVKRDAVYNAMSCLDVVAT